MSRREKNSRGEAAFQAQLAKTACEFIKGEEGDAAVCITTRRSTSGFAKDSSSLYYAPLAWQHPIAALCARSRSHAM